MNNNKKLNTTFDVLTIAFISVFMVLVSKLSFLTITIVPVILGIFFIRKEIFESISLVISIFILTYIYSFTRENYLIISCLLILGFSIFLLIKFNISDKISLLVIFIIAVIILNFGYYYIIKMNLIDMNKLLDEFLFMARKEGYDFKREFLVETLENIPAILGFLGFLYAIISLKVTRNYLNYKDKNIRDFSKINTLSIRIKEVLFYLVFFVSIFFMAKYFHFHEYLIEKNAISLGVSLLQLNGIFTLDYVVEKRNSKFYRIFTWLIVILLFSFLSIFFLIVGLMDIIFNLRGAIYARKKQTF